MVNNETSNEAWQQLFEVEHLCRYYERVHASATRWQIIIRLATLILIAGAITAILELLPWANDISKVSLAALVAALTIVDAVLNFPKKAAVSHSLYVQCSQLRVDVMDLWLSVEDEAEDETDLRRRVRDLIRRKAVILVLEGAYDLIPDQKANVQTAKDASTVLSQRYDAGLPNIQEGT